MAKTVEEYLDGNIWEKELEILREIMLELDLEEAVRWGMPAYLVDGKNIIGVCSFKSYFGIWFHHGVFLKDPKKVLMNAQEGKTVGMRQWRFSHKKEIDKKLIQKYVIEAIQNQRDGLVVKPVKKKKELIIPEELQKVLKSKKTVRAMFENLTPGKQREVADYISEAKRESTRQNRLEKCIQWMKEGLTPMDQYRK